MSAPERPHHGVVWHPNVHHYFGERLYCLLIQMSQYVPSVSEEGESQSPVERIHALLSRLQARGHCIYEVFGDADVLVRLWLDVHTYEALGKQLSSEQLIASVAAFLCDREEYLWAVEQGRWREITEHEIAKNEKTIQDLAVGLSNASVLTESQQGARKSLYDDGFILKDIVAAPGPEGDEARASSGRDRIKFFTFFRLSAKLASQPRQVISILRTQCRDLGVAVSELSAFFGNGQLGNLLVNGTTESYYDIYRLVVDAFSALVLEGPPHTYLAASADWHESDDLAAHRATADMKIRRIFAFAGVSFDVSAGVAMDDPRAKQLMKVYDSISPLLAIDEERVLTELVRGLLEQDERIVRRGATFLFDIEMYLRDYFFQQVQISNPGGNHTKLIMREIERLRKDAEDKGGSVPDFPERPDRLTLKYYGILLSKLCDAQDVVQVLGESWLRDMETTTELRNEIAHGKFVDGIKKWSDHVSRMVPSLRLYYNLRKWSLAHERNE